MCPSRVPYARLLDAGRARLTEVGRRRTPPAVRAIERASRSPKDMDQLIGTTGTASRLGLTALLSHLPSIGGQAMATFARAVPARDTDMLAPIASTDPSRPKVQLFLGCLDRHWNRAALRDAIRAIEACGYTVLIPDGQTCCGAISQHEGQIGHASTLLATNRAAFSAEIPVISISTGCSSQLREHLGQPGEDLLDFLDSRRDRLDPAPLTERVALHVPCSQRNVLGSERVSARLLATIPDLTVLRLRQEHGCCGAAGTHFLREPATAAVLRDDLLDQLEQERPDRLLSPNLGCALHLRAGLLDRGLDIPVEHPVSLLARQLARS